MKKIVSLIVSLVLAGAANAHGKLESATPAQDSKLQQAPKEIRLRFNEPLEASFSNIKLNPAGKPELDGLKAAVDPADPKVLVLPTPSLASGAYRVQWSVMTHDGHKVKGEYHFQVR